MSKTAEPGPGLQLVCDTRMRDSHPVCSGGGKKVLFRGRGQVPVHCGSFQGKGVSGMIMHKSLGLADLLPLLLLPAESTSTTIQALTTRRALVMVV